VEEETGMGARKITANWNIPPLKIIPSIMHTLVYGEHSDLKISMARTLDYIRIPTSYP